MFFSDQASKNYSYLEYQFIYYFIYVCPTVIHVAARCLPCPGNRASIYDFSTGWFTVRDKAFSFPPPLLGTLTTGMLCVLWVLVWVPTRFITYVRVHICVCQKTLNKVLYDIRLYSQDYITRVHFPSDLSARSRARLYVRLAEMPVGRTLLFINMIDSII